MNNDTHTKYHLLYFYWNIQDDDEKSERSISDVSDVIEDIICDIYGICQLEGHDCFYHRYCRQITSNYGCIDNDKNRLYISYKLPEYKLKEIVPVLMRVAKTYNLVIRWHI